MNWELIFIMSVIVYFLTYFSVKEKKRKRAAVYSAVVAVIMFVVPLCLNDGDIKINVAEDSQIEKIQEKQKENIDQSPEIYQQQDTVDNNSEIYQEDINEDDKKEFVELAELLPLISKNEEFWYTRIGMDNIGETHVYEIFCGAENYSKEITYALDKKYRWLKGNISLSYYDNDIGKYIWIEFYGDDRKIGETERFAAGVRPSSFQIDVSGITDLKIVTNSESIHTSGFLLTDGFFLYYE